MSKYVINPRFELNTPKKSITYEIMHMDKVVATISTLGQAKIINEQFMPYDMYLEESIDFDDLGNNLANFYHWCASRVLSLDRTYAKEIMNSLGVSQVAYEEYFYDGEIVTQSVIVTSKQYSMVSKMAYDVYAINNDLDTILRKNQGCCTIGQHP